jgi:hypothetical protein
MKKGFMDIEPTWVALLSVVERGANPEILRPACELADEIRQAQKHGAKSIKLTFDKKGKVMLREVI